MTVPAERLRELLHYDPDTGVFTWKVRKAKNTEIGGVAGSMTNRGRAEVRIDGRMHKVHRLAWLYVHGEWPSAQIDHIDENPSNNRIGNLRLATNAQNTQNRSKPRSDNTSGYLGVSYRSAGARWRASIVVDGKQQHLGYFDTPEQASEAYIAAKKKFHPFWVDNRAEQE